jgi:hypothetical protein
MKNKKDIIWALVLTLSIICCISYPKIITSYEKYIRKQQEKNIEDTSWLYEGNLTFYGYNGEKTGMPIVFGDGLEIGMVVDVNYRMIGEPLELKYKELSIEKIKEIINDTIRMTVREILQSAAPCYNANDLTNSRSRTEFVNLVKYMFKNGIVKFEWYEDGDLIKRRVSDMNIIETKPFYERIEAEVNIISIKCTPLPQEIRF